jgi:mycoketide-CoA synthase
MALPELAEVLAAKVLGAAHLDELLDHDAVDAVVLFSSVAGVWGASNQGAYSAANAFLDALAQRRCALGGRTVSIAWGPWNAGMVTQEGAGEQLRRGGLPPMEISSAVSMLDQIITRNEPCPVVVDVDWQRFVPSYTTQRPRPFLRDLPDVRRMVGVEPDTVGAKDASLVRRLAELPEDDRNRAVLDLVLLQVAGVLGYASPNEVDEQRAFKEIGFDSLTAVQLRNRLAKATGLRLPVTLVFDYPTPAGLAAHLRAEVADEVPTVYDAAFAQFDRLESMLSAVPQDDAALGQLAARVQELLTRLTGTTGTEKAAETQTIETATDDELFDFINKQLGRRTE